MRERDALSRPERRQKQSLEVVSRSADRFRTGNGVFCDEMAKEPKMNWKNKRTLVTGGASFIGSALVDALVYRGATVRVVDNFSSGRRENLASHLKSDAIELVHADLLDDGVARQAVQGMDLVFHLAADHGGRGYVDLHQAACAGNLGLDGMLFRGRGSDISCPASSRFQPLGARCAVWLTSTQAKFQKAQALCQTISR